MSDFSGKRATYFWVVSKIAWKHKGGYISECHMIASNANEMLHFHMKFIITSVTIVSEHNNNTFFA